MIPSNRLERPEDTSSPGRRDALYLANGCIEMNPWNAYGIARPTDYLVIDLDPVNVPARVIEAAVAVRKVLERAGATSLCKSGQTRPARSFLGRSVHDDESRNSRRSSPTRPCRVADTTSVVRDPRKRQVRAHLRSLANRKGRRWSPRTRSGLMRSDLDAVGMREVSKRLDASVFTIRQYSGGSTGWAICGSRFWIRH